MYSHFATSDDTDESFAREQLARFTDIRNILIASGQATGIVFHLANSGGLLLSPETHFDLVRPGLMLYGYLPDPRFSSQLSLRPALSVKSRITHIFKAYAGESVSYGRRWYAERESRIATLPIGYADGIPRALTNKMEVIIR